MKWCVMSEDDGGGLSTGVIIGIAVGCAVAVIVIIVIIVCVCIRMSSEKGMSIIGNKLICVM